MRLTQLAVKNYRGLRDVTVPLSRFGCLIGENNAGKSSFLQALALFFSGSRLAASHFFDETKPIRIAVTFDAIDASDLARLAPEHRSRVAAIADPGRLTLVRVYGADGKSTLQFETLVPTDPRFGSDRIGALLKGQKAGPAFVKKVVEVFPELTSRIDATMNQDAVNQAIQELATSLPESEKVAADQPLPTGIDKSIAPMLPDPIYIPAVKDLADDIKTTESTPFGKILAILLPAVEAKLPAVQKLFELLNANLNLVSQADGTVVDGRLDEVKLIESTLERYVRESFADVVLRITIPPPDLKTVFSSARLYANDGVDGLIDSKGDGLRRAIVFSILRAYVDLKAKLGRLGPPTESSEHPDPEQDSQAVPAPAAYLLLFEEPELFLHPKAQNVLFSALKVFAQEHHVLVTTHSPMFFGPNATETFVKLRKVLDPAVAAKPFTRVQPVDLSDLAAKDQFQIICYENNNAAFFADTVVLVEGDSDYLLMPHIARTVDPVWDVARAPVLFARITGKGNIRRYREFFVRFGVRVPVIADLDLLVGGFENIVPSDSLKKAREALLARVDELIEPDTDAPTAKEAREAHASGDLRGLWRLVKDRRVALIGGLCTQEEHDEAVEAFFAWQRQSDRLAVLESSCDERLLALKWQLLAMLRAVDVFVLERGAIEKYYPDTVTGRDKPSRAQSFCSTVTSRDAVLGCCGEQRYNRDGVEATVKEFELIFGGIFEGKPPDAVRPAPKPTLGT